MSIEVDDLDAVYPPAREAGAEIVYPLTEEEWGLRRFSCATQTALCSTSRNIASAPVSSRTSRIFCTLLFRTPNARRHTGV